MKKATRSTPRWFSTWRARPVATPDIDAADYGTAFGLDLSIPSSDAPARTVAPAPQGWRARWSSRRRTA